MVPTSVTLGRFLNFSLRCLFPFYTPCQSSSIGVEAYTGLTTKRRDPTTLIPCVASAQEMVGQGSGDVQNRKTRCNGNQSHLGVVQLILAHNLDGAFLVGLAVDRFVDIGECTVSHFLDQLVLFKSLRSVEAICQQSAMTHIVTGHLFGLRSLLGDYPLGLLPVVGRVRGGLAGGACCQRVEGQVEPTHPRRVLGPACLAELVVPAADVAAAAALGFAPVVVVAEPWKICASADSVGPRIGRACRVGESLWIRGEGRDRRARREGERRYDVGVEREEKGWVWAWFVEWEEVMSASSPVRMAGG